MTVKVSAKLTKEQQAYNGLDALQSELVKNPHGRRYAVIAYDVLRITTEVDEGTEIPTVQLVHIEPVRDDHADTVQQILAERYKDRTGRDDSPPAQLFDVLDGDGERVVPEASGEELLAERRERKAREAAEAESDGAA